MNLFLELFLPYKECDHCSPLPVLAMACHRKPGSRLRTILSAFAASSTIHGLRYVGEPRSPRGERLLWVLAILLGLLAAAVLSRDFLADYQTNQSVTTLGSSAKPVTEIDFPAITICSQGLNMDAVTRAIELDFQEWRKEQPNETPDFKEFLEAKFSMDPAEDYNLMDILNSLASPNVDATAGQNTARENLIACSEDNSLNPTTSNTLITTISNSATTPPSLTPFTEVVSRRKRQTSLSCYGTDALGICIGKGELSSTAPATAPDTITASGACSGYFSYYLPCTGYGNNCKDASFAMERQGKYFDRKLSKCHILSSVFNTLPNGNYWINLQCFTVENNYVTSKAKNDYVCVVLCSTGKTIKNQNR